MKNKKSVLALLIAIAIYFACCSNNQNKIIGNNTSTEKVISDSLRQALGKSDTFTISDLYLFLNKNPIKDFIKTTPQKMNVVKYNGYEFQTFCIDRELKLYSYSMTTFYTNPEKNQRDFLLYGNKKFLIDSLYWRDKIPNDHTFMTLFTAVYKFQFNKRNYIAMFSGDASVPTTRPNSLVILIDYTNPKKITFPLVDYQACDDISCFGDFNKDGSLDYIKWGVGWEYKDTIFSYTILNGDFLRDINHFIKIDSEVNIGEYKVNFKNSNWW